MFQQLHASGSSWLFYEIWKDDIYVEYIWKLCFVLDVGEECFRTVTSSKSIAAPSPLQWFSEGSAVIKPADDY